MATTRFLAGLVALACFAASALATPIVTITPSASSVERGGTVTFTVAATGLEVLYRYQAQLALPAGMSVNGNSAIHNGDFFTSSTSQTPNPSIPCLIVQSTGMPPYEAHTSGTLASFDVTVAQAMALAGATVTTAGTNMQDDVGWPVSNIQQGSTSVNVVAPQMSLSQLNLELLADPGYQQTHNIMIGNDGLGVTVLNGVVGPMVFTQFNDHSVGSIANPFAITSGLGGFDLAGGSPEHTLSIAFAPSVNGKYAGYFDITSDDGIGGSQASGSTARVYVFGTTTIMPEPASMMLIAIGSLVVARRRRH